MLKPIAFVVLLSSSACEDSNSKAVRDVEEQVSTVADKVDDLKRDIEEMIRQRRSAAREGKHDEASIRRP